MRWRWIHLYHASVIVSKNSIWRLKVANRHIWFTAIQNSIKSCKYVEHLNLFKYKQQHAQKLAPLQIFSNYNRKFPAKSKLKIKREIYCNEHFFNAENLHSENLCTLVKTVTWRKVESAIQNVKSGQVSP